MNKLTFTVGRFCEKPLSLITVRKLNIEFEFFTMIYSLKKSNLPLHTLCISCNVEEIHRFENKRKNLNKTIRDRAKEILGAKDFVYRILVCLLNCAEISES